MDWVCNSKIFLPLAAWPFVKIIQGLASATIIVCIVTSLIVMLTVKLHYAAFHQSLHCL